MSRTPTRIALILGTALLASACSVAPAITPQEAEIQTDLAPSQYMPATRQMRDAIETQELFAQAAFWSREYDLNPSDLESAIKLAAAVRRLGNPKRAVEITQTTRALYPRDPYLTAEFAAALIADERAVDALVPLDQALAMAPGYARLWSLKGAALDQQEQYQMARQHYNRALQITPKDPNVLANLGLSYALQGDAVTAETWLRRAVAQPGASASVRQNLSLVLQLQGKTEDAERVAALTAAPQKYPTMTPAKRPLIPQQPQARLREQTMQPMTTGNMPSSSFSSANAMRQATQQPVATAPSGQVNLGRVQSAAPAPTNATPEQQQAMLARIAESLRPQAGPQQTMAQQPAPQSQPYLPQGYVPQNYAPQNSYAPNGYAPAPQMVGGPTPQPAPRPTSNRRRR